MPRRKTTTGRNNKAGAAIGAGGTITGTGNGNTATASNYETDFIALDRLITAYSRGLGHPTLANTNLLQFMSWAEQYTREKTKTRIASGSRTMTAGAGRSGS